ncbi:hypothetical protein ASD34_24355 [Variovorax sp. Root473]|nr:hypothetical protein ASD34_24355 [Variovorax sp. Root473]
MACVELEGFLEHGGYLITISIDKREGDWCSWAQFEEALEYDGSLQIPVYRHRVPGAFNTREGSIDAGIAYARQTVEAGKVVIHPHTRHHQSWGLH